MEHPENSPYLTDQYGAPIMDGRWHLDKRVPLALILAMFMQTAGIVWWGATTSQRILTLEERVNLAMPQGDRLTRVEVKIDNIAESITELKQAVRTREEPTNNRH